MARTGDCIWLWRAWRKPFWSAITVLTMGDIIVHDKIADHLLNIYNGLNFLAGGEFFQRFNQAILVRFCNMGLEWGLPM